MTSTDEEEETAKNNLTIMSTFPLKKECQYDTSFRWKRSKTLSINRISWSSRNFLLLMSISILTFNWNWSCVDSLLSSPSSAVFSSATSSSSSLMMMHPHQLPSYETKIACEGNQLELSCEEGSKINLIRANFGRFSISICNHHGNPDWSVNCMSRRSFRVIQEMCGSRSECTLFASSVYFGDPCPGVHKYLEVHYQCLPESFKPSASPPALIPLSSTSITSSGTSTANVNNNNNVNHKHSKQQPSNRSHKPNNVVTSLDINGSNNSNNQSRVESTTTSTASSVVSSFDSSSTQASSSSPSSSSSTTTTVMSDDIVSSSPSPSDPDLHPPVIDLSQHHKPHRNNNNNHPNPRIQSPHHPSISSPIPTVFGSSSDIIDDYDATTSPLDSDDSSSSSSSTSNSLPLSEPLRLLLTIGCVFGIICLFLTMLSLVLAVFPSNNGNNNSNSLHLHHQLQHPHRALVSSSLRGTSNLSSSRLELQVKQNLTLCLLITEVLFLTGINVSQSRFFCGIISSTLHYFFLSIFIWLFFDGFTLYLALLKNQESSSSNNVPFDDLTINHVNNHYSHSQHQFHMQRISCPSPSTSSRNSRPCRSYLLIAYGLPLIIQVISSLMDTGSFLLTTTNPTHCWLRSDKYFVLTFVGPVIAVLSANFLFLAITVVCSNYGSLFSLDNNNSGSQVVISNVNSLNNINKAYSEQQHPVVEASPTTSPSSSSGKVSPLRIRLRTSLTVFVVMSLTLTALFVSLCQELPGDELVFTSCLYVFSILNPLQVLVIFVIFSSSSSMAKQNSVKVLTSLGFLEASKSSDNHENHLHSNNQSLSSNSRGFKVDMIPQEPIIPSLPHSSKLNIDVASPDHQQHQLNQQQESDAVSVGQGSKSYASDYGFRGNLAAAQSSASSALNYRSPVYGSHATNAGNASSNLQANAGSIIRTTGRLGYIHTKQCLQFPCQFPHVVEHVYESIDEDPYIARLLLPIEVSNRHRNVSTAL